ncbi:MAG TPA: hypothetical protein PK297_13770 [Spirochaetota bacterium]|nr:hypothetical protein [Spirochaetota bacterium]
MYKSMLVVGLVALMAVPCLAKTGWERDGLKGKVRQRVWESYYIKESFGQDERVHSGKAVSIYDTRGNKT